MQDCKDESGFQFTKFDLVSGGKEIKIAIFEACEQPRVGVSRFVLGFTPVSCCSREELQPDGRFAASSLVCLSRLNRRDCKQATILAEFGLFVAVALSLKLILLRFHHFLAIFSSYFKIIKQAPDKNLKHDIWAGTVSLQNIVSSSAPRNRHFL